MAIKKCPNCDSSMIKENIFIEGKNKFKIIKCAKCPYQNKTEIN